MRETKVELLEIAKLTADAGFHARHAAVFKADASHRWFPVPLVCDGHVLIGEATIAQSIYLGKTHVFCRVVEASNDAKQTARHMDLALGAGPETLAFLAAVSHDVAANEPPPTRKPNGGGLITPRGEARRRVARWINCTEETLKALERRVGKAGVVKPSADQSRKWSLHCYGFTPAPGIEARAAHAHAKMAAADFSFRRIHGELKSIENAPDYIASMIPALVENALLLRSRLPFALCPWCKSTLAVMPRCLPCSQQGWVSKEVFNAAPEALRVRPWVVMHGEYLDMQTMRKPVAERRPQSADFGARDSYDEEEEPPV